MKVICIDGKPKHPMAIQLPEGAVLHATQCNYYPDCYDIIGYERGIDGRPISHRKIRFIPLSDIDETELVNEKQLQSCGG